MERLRTDSLNAMGCFRDKEAEALLVLMRSGLWEREPDDWSLFPLSDDSWQSVYQLAVGQTITGIVYRGICHLPDRFLPSGKILMRWVAAVDAIERQNRKMNAVLAELYDLFTSEGVAVVLQKGQGVALMYEQPMLRECGDIDFYFLTRKDCAESLRILKSRNIRVTPAADDSFHYTWKGVKVEHHVRLFDVHNRYAVSLLKEKEREKGFVRLKMPGGQGADIWVPSPLLNIVMLNMHIMKHALGYGVGLRQFCDMARASWSLRHDVDFRELRTVCEKTGIGKWSRLLYAFLAEYAGLPEDVRIYGEKPLSPRPLLDIVLKGGNFGFHDRFRAGVVEKAVWKRKLHTLWAYLRRFAFSVRYAPQEMCWTLFSLTRGQFK